VATGLRGRPRTFDRDGAVRDAARLFWRQGFSGTSTRQLAISLGISASSLYAAFGSKAELFDEAVRTYAKRYSVIYEAAVAETRLHTVVEHLLTDSVLEFTQPLGEHPGCLASSAAMADEPQTLNARTFVADLQRADEQLLRERIQQAVRSGELVEGTDGALLTGVIQAMWQGLSFRAERGAGREELLAVAKLAASLMTSG